MKEKTKQLILDIATALAMVLTALFIFSLMIVYVFATPYQYSAESDLFREELEMQRRQLPPHGEGVQQERVTP